MLECTEVVAGCDSHILEWSLSFDLGQGVVYRLKDSSLTVAFDDIPEGGLNTPLRLEKVSNEVTYRRLKDTIIQLSKGVQQGNMTVTAD